MLGLARGTVRLVPHQDEWVNQFAEEAARLADGLGSGALTVEHVGSTAIHPIDAKPIIDILVAVNSLDEAENLTPVLKTLGYTRKPKGDLPDRRFFVKGPEDARTHHLSLTQIGSPTWVGHVLFRDYLRSNEQTRSEYQMLKRALAERYPSDRDTYTKEKAPFITEILKRALRDENL